MIRPHELFVLALEENFGLKNHEMHALYESLHNPQFCVLKSGRSKNQIYQKAYNTSWLFKRLEEVRSKIKFWRQTHKLQIITQDHSLYPSSFLKLSNPPYGFFVYGYFDKLQRCLGIVGRREAKTYTLNWMQENLPSVIKTKGLTIVSGGARGVDAKAHNLALMNDLKTVYIIPSGLLNIYPEHLQVQRQELVQAGAVFISTYHPEGKMQKQNFADRNLLIAALSEKIIILEAELRSGTYKTAKFALDLGTAMGVVPSFPEDQSYSGSLQLIYDGAQMLRDHKDVQIFLEDI